MFVLSAIQMSARLLTYDATSFCFLILHIGLTKSTTTGNCSVYCTSDGQQKNSLNCPLTSQPFYCCGSTAYKYCCSNSTLQANMSCANGSIIKFDWIIIVTIAMTVIIFLLGLIGCLCLCHKRCGCKNVVCSAENGEQQPLSETRTESAAHPSNASDFDPTSPCAFSPPAYDSLPKDPPAYMEIFSISTGYDYNSSNSNQTNFHSVSNCNDLNQSQPLPENTSQEATARGSSQSRSPSVLDLSLPYPPDAVSLNPPPSYSSRPNSCMHRPSLRLAIELHPLNLGVSGNLLSSPPTEAGVLPTTV